MEMLMSTELTLGLPGTDESIQKSPTNVKTNKRYSPDTSDESRSPDAGNAPPAKAQVVGWPPVRSYRKSCFEPKKSEGEVAGMYVKVSMVGAPYLRKIDLKVYKSYSNLLMALEDMFKFSIGEYSESEGYKNGCDYTPTYEDKDGDWMMVGDVPWDMFISSCKRLKIMKGSEARGLNSL